MGLGLAIGRTIAERHGGRLWLDTGSRQTTFCLELPIEPAQ
jgi:signal transduction histidine kinase